jgi:hypothetical protein
MFGNNMTLYKPSDQAWSWFFVVTGMCMVIIFKHFGVDTNLAAGVIGAGLQAYTSTNKKD